MKYSLGFDGEPTKQICTVDDCRKLCRGSEDGAIGRSRSGLSTNISIAVNALGNPVRFILTAAKLPISVVFHSKTCALTWATTEIGCAPPLHAHAQAVISSNRSAPGLHLAVIYLWNCCHLLMKKFHCITNLRVLGPTRKRSHG
jgi:hypothetical protein